MEYPFTQPPASLAKTSRDLDFCSIFSIRNVADALPKMTFLYVRNVADEEHPA
jgi:hypothetical protein